jgi:inward rectifier potassium channel
MATRVRTRKFENGLNSYTFTVIDDRPIDLRDISHMVLGLTWPVTLAVILGAYLLINLLFALGFLATGGVVNVAPGSLKDAFFFSVQTMATIGYGDMHPASDAAHLMVLLESMVSLVFTGISTGLMFVRFARIRGRVVFSKHVALGVIDGKPHLCVRVGNGRSNRIFDAQFKLIMMRTVTTADGHTLYRTADLKLVRETAPNLQRAWNLMHVIDEHSPMFGMTPERFVAEQAEISLAVTGTDETTLQAVHGRHVWESPALEWGTRLDDVVAEAQDGNVTMDLRNFDKVRATAPTAEFPWPRR